MRQITKTDPITGEANVVTMVTVLETLRNGLKMEHEMQLRHALQAMRVSNKFELAKGEKLPKGVTVEMVPPGTTLEDVAAFEKRKGKVGKITKTNFDNVLDAIEKGVDISEIENIEITNANITKGAMMSDEAPKGFKPEGVDLPESMKIKKADEKLRKDQRELEKRTEKENPVLKDLTEKELNFKEKAVATPKYKQEELRRMNKDVLQAVALGLPNLTDKMKEGLMKADKSHLIDSIIQLSKIKPKKAGE